MTAQPRAVFSVLVLTGMAWGLTMPFSKIVVASGYRHFGIIFWQQVVCATIVLLWLALRQRPLPVTRAALQRYFFIALFGTIIPNSASYIAQERLPAGLVAVCFALIPMMALPLALAVRIERPEPKRLLGIFAGMTGILLIVLPDASLPDRTAMPFVLFALSAAFCYAVEGVGLGKLGPAGLDPIQLLAGAAVTSLLFALPLSVATGSWITPGQGAFRIDLALVAVAAIHTLCYAGYVWMVGNGGPVFASQVSYVVTGSGVIWAMILLGERYSLWVWMAISVVFIGLFLVQPRPARGLPAAAPSAPGADQTADTR